MDRITFGRFITKYRKDAGLSQQQLADILQVSCNSISNIEIGKFYPTAENLFTLVTELNIPLDSLLLKDGKKENVNCSQELLIDISLLSPEDREYVASLVKRFLNKR